MSEVKEIKDGDTMEFFTELPRWEEPIESCTFSLMGQEWKFSIRMSVLNYEIYIKTVTKDIAFKSFKIEYRAEWILGKNETLGKGIRIVESINCFVWAKSIGYMEKKLPPDYRKGNVMKFEFTFHLPSAPVSIVKSKTEESKTQDKSVQTCSYLNAEIKCGEHSIKVPQIILCKQSEVLSAMLQSDQQVDTSGIIEIQDVDINYVQEFINYLSTGAMPELTFEKAKILYEAADKYAVRSLMIRCSEYLQDNLSPENAVECFTLADATSDQTLKGKIKNYMLEEKIYLQDELWLPFSEKFPKEANEVYRLSYKRKASEMDDE